MILLGPVACAGCHRPVIVYAPFTPPNSMRNPDGTYHTKPCACNVIGCGCSTYICPVMGWHQPHKTDRCLPCLRGMHERGAL